ncbi:MAG TPA: CAP domain-containing protein [Planctomycetota bacterium]|jgi:uncharacterized protein YkwD|nr:CAP domain-containing protein [Planctomycetota bacterium]
MGSFHLHVAGLAVPVPPEGMTVGSAPDNGLVVPGAEARHCRILPHGSGFLVRDHGSRAGTFLNGEEVGEAPLHPGDEIRLGSATLRCVESPGEGDGMSAETARDALAEEILVGAFESRSSTVPSRSAIPATVRLPSGRRRSSLPFLVGTLLFVGVPAAYLLDRARARTAGEETLRLASAGDFDGARAAAAKVPGDDRAALEKAIADAAAARESVRRKCEDILAERGQKSRLEVLEALQALREKALDDATRAEVDLRIASLPDLPAPPARVSVPAPVAVAPPTSIPAPTRFAREELFASVEDLVRDNRFGQALELLRMASADGADPVRARYAEVFADAERALARLAEDVERLERDGSLEEALALSERHAQDFPGEGALAGLTERAARLRVEVAEAHARPPTSPPPPAVAEAAPAASLEKARALERERRFEEARQSYEREREAARDDATKARLAGLAADAQRQAWFLAFLADAAASDREAVKGIDLGVPGAGDPIGGDHEGLRFSGPAGETRIGWNELPASALARLFGKTRPGPRDQLDAAVFFLRAGLEREADRALASAIERDPPLKGEADAVLARARGIDVPEGGFLRFRDRWVGGAERDAILLAERIDRLLERLDAAEGRARESLVAELEGLGEKGRGPFLEALRRRRGKVGERLLASPATKRLAKLREGRLELDRRRAHALALIFDEEAYFYPFEPPACPPEKAAGYWEVQQEVDRRVEAVRESLASAQPVPLGKARRALRDWHEIGRWIAGAGGAAEPVEGLADWEGVDPQVEEATLANFALDAREREETVAFSARVLAFNAAGTRRYGISPEERGVLDLTNEYRLLLGRRALAVNPKLSRSARGHSAEMADRGYFSHFSEAPGRRTPFDRMKLEGYEKGVSENIARVGGAEGAVTAWRHSSGHHRNLLAPGHRELGVGAVSSLFTQNFGTGEEFLREPDWR